MATQVHFEDSDDITVALQRLVPAPICTGVSEIRNLFACAFRSAILRLERETHEAICAGVGGRSKVFRLSHGLGDLVAECHKASAIAFADLFEIAKNNSDCVGGDPAEWAHNLLRAWLDSELRPAFNPDVTVDILLTGAIPDPIERWLRVACLGYASHDILGEEPSTEEVRAHLEDLACWQAPAWAAGFRTFAVPEGPEDQTLSASETAQLCTDFRSDFIRRMRSRIEEQLLAPARIQLAKEGWRSETAGRSHPEARPSMAPVGANSKSAEPPSVEESDASLVRAQTVQRVIEELSQIKSRMPVAAGSEEYEQVRNHFPGSIVFEVCDRAPDLRLLLENIREHQQHVRFAQQIVAAKYGRTFFTVEKDWKTHKPRKADVSKKSDAKSRNPNKRGKRKPSPAIQ